MIMEETVALATTVVPTERVVLTTADVLGAFGCIILVGDAVEGIEVMAVIATYTLQIKVQS